MSQTPEEESEFDYEGDYANAARQLNRLVRLGHSYSGHERNRCFLNVHGQRFANVSMTSGFDFPEDGRAIAICDWDADGRQDFWVANRTAPQIRFMRNQVDTADQHYVAFRLAGTRSNRDGIGARVRVELERDGMASSLVRSLRAGEGFLSCSSKSLHFGLGSATSVRLVEVRWPTGSVESFGGIPEVDGVFDLVEGSGQIEQRESAVTNLVDTPSSPRSALPDQSFETHNLLTERIALPPLTYVSLDDSIADASQAAGHPVLINLWATWCQPCLKELSEWSQRDEELRRIGVEVIALSVDQVSGDQSSSQQDSSVDIAGYLKRLGFKQTAGNATTQALDALQHVHNTIYDHHRPLPVPTSFLLDGRGRLSAVYKGPVSVDRILQDVQAMALEGTALAESGLPFGGRWLGPLRLHNVSQIVEDLWQDGYEDEAIEYVHRLNPSRYSPHVTRSRLFLAQQYEARDQHREAAALLNETLRDEPNNPVAHERLGILLARQGDAGAALAHLQRATLEFDPPRADAHFNLGRLLRKTGDVERAAAELSRAVAIRPKFAAAHEQLGLLFASQGRMEPAVSHFRAATRAKPRGFASSSEHLHGAPPFGPRRRSLVRPRNRRPA